MTAIGNIEDRIVRCLLDISPDILKRFRKGLHKIKRKPNNTWVTDSDFYVQGILIRELAHILPNSYFLGEENRCIKQEKCRRIFDKKYIWAVDPIDGTDNFVNNIPFFAVSVGLLEKGANGHKPIAGAVLFPALNEIAYTKDGKSYYMQLDAQRQIELQMLKRKDGAPVVMLTGSFQQDYNFNYGVSDAKPRISGSTVVDMFYTATGKSIGTMTKAQLWDIAGSLAVAHNLGVNMRRYSDGKVHDSFVFDDLIFSCNPKRDWRLKEMHIVSTQENYQLMRQIIEKK